MSQNREFRPHARQFEGDPRNHHCHADGCEAWGMFGSGRHWWCPEHRPAPGAADANAVRPADAARPRQSRLL